MSEDLYQPPSAELTPPTASGRDPREGSLSSALAGDYDFEIGEIAGDAWRLVKGNKLITLGLAIVCLLIYGLAFAVVNALGIPDGQAEMAAGNFGVGFLKSQVQGLALMPITAPITIGVLMFAIRRSGGEMVGISELFGYFQHLPRLIVISLISTVLIAVGTLMLVLPGIYLSIAYTFATPLMIDKGLSPWEALEASRKSVTHHWFKFLGLGIVMYIATMVLGITIIGFFWAMPFFLLALGLTYRRVFGFGPEVG